MKITLAQRAIGRDGIAPESVDGVIAGVKLPWIELDGHRIDSSAGVIAASFEAASDEVASVRLVLEVTGPVQIVYLDHDGVPLPGGAVEESDPARLGRIDYKTAVARP